MLRIVDGELRIKLEDNELNAGLVPVILKRYERVIADNASMMYEIKKLKESQPRVFSFSNN